MRSRVSLKLVFASCVSSHLYEQQAPLEQMVLAEQLVSLFEEGNRCDVAHLVRTDVHGNLTNKPKKGKTNITHLGEIIDSHFMI